MHVCNPSLTWILGLVHVAFEKIARLRCSESGLHKSYMHTHTRAHAQHYLLGDGRGLPQACGGGNHGVVGVAPALAGLLGRSEHLHLFRRLSLETGVRKISMMGG